MTALFALDEENVTSRGHQRGDKYWGWENGNKPGFPIRASSSRRRAIPVAFEPSTSLTVLSES